VITIVKPPSYPASSSILLRSLFATITIVLALSACGQKGPLYLPEKPSAAPTVAAPANKAQKSNPDSSAANTTSGANTASTPR
jgi:predicted small lipoprotein YifL